MNERMKYKTKLLEKSIWRLPIYSVAKHKYEPFFLRSFTSLECKYHLKSTGNTRNYSWCCIIYNCRKVNTAVMQQRPFKGAVYWLDPQRFLCKNLYRLQDHQSKGVCTFKCAGALPHLSLIKQMLYRLAKSHLFWKHEFKVPSFQIAITCVKLTQAIQHSDLV